MDLITDSIYKNIGVNEHLINEKICYLIEFGINHKKLRFELLKSIMELIPSDAPSTIFSLNRSFYANGNLSQTEKTFDFSHQNLPHKKEVANIIQKDIENHITSISSVIEAEIYRKFDYPHTGVTNLKGLYQLTHLLNRKCLRQIALNSMKTIDVKDVLFGWIRVNLNEVWIIALRRFQTKPTYTQEDYVLLKTFVSRFYDFRKAWNKEDSGNTYLELLTHREQEAIYHFVCGLRDKETAFQMNISKRTLDTHWQNIFNKLGVCDKIMVLDKLGMIKKHIKPQNEKGKSQIAFA
jgi:hypothetical protein